MLSEPLRRAEGGLPSRSLTAQKGSEITWID
jgi:hypothetical protein